MVVSPAEVVRIVALAVMARPENAGRVCPMVMPGSGADGVPRDVPELHVVACDTQEEAAEVSRHLAQAQELATPLAAPALHLVPGAKLAVCASCPNAETCRASGVCTLGR